MAGGKAPGVKPIDLSFKLFLNEFVADAFMVGNNDNGEIALSISLTTIHTVHTCTYIHTLLT